MEAETEDLKIRIRGYLQQHGIRLWEHGDRRALIADISSQLGLRPGDGDCAPILAEMERLARDRIQLREAYQQTGRAALRVKWAGQPAGQQPGQRETVSACRLPDPARALLLSLAAEAAAPLDRLKLIHKGKIIKADETLESQGVRHGALLLLIVLPDDSVPSAPETTDHEDDSASTRRDAEFLADSDTFGHYLQLEDQDGNLIHFPKKQQKALTVAVALQERGRTALKHKDYARALVLLLDADKLYGECDADILRRVDNYGLLNLDIAWCYLQLKSVTHIPDASERLKICEKNFNDTYGKDLSRLKAVKGTGGYERILLMRLHLLQGIVLYYENKRDAALKILKEVEIQLNVSKIDEGNIQAMVDMGFTSSEAKLALRACNGTISEAVDYIAKQRAKKELSKHNSVEEQMDRLLGKCDDGNQYVSSKIVDIMLSMGYNKKTAVKALKKFNNDLSNAVEYVSEQYQNVSTVPDEYKEIVGQLVSLGYDTEEAMKMLNKMKKDIESGLTSTLGLSNEQGPSTSAFEVVLKEDKLKKMKEAKEAYKRLSKVIDDVEDDGLDLNLAEEEEFLKCYLNLLKR